MYEDIPIAHALNYHLYDTFVQSGEADIREWLGREGRMLVSLMPATDPRGRMQEVFDYIHALGLDDLEAWMNVDSSNPAVRLSLRNGAQIVVLPVPGDGRPWIEHPRFLEDYREYHARR